MSIVATCSPLTAMVRCTAATMPPAASAPPFSASERLTIPRSASSSLRCE